MKVSVVSYKRPNNQTCNMLMKTNFDWKVYVYLFDEHLNEYISNYQTHVRVINEMDSPNLAIKRQLVLNDAIIEKVDYLVMLDDDIQKITLNNNESNLTDALIFLLEFAYNNNQYVAVSAAYHFNKPDIVENKNICNNSIFNIKKYMKSNVKYNKDSKCEDAEFTIDLLLNGFKTARLGTLVINNVLQGGQDDTGLAYRFKDNRFIIEGDYLSQRYPELYIFDYDETHLSIKTNLIKGDAI